MKINKIFDRVKGKKVIIVGDAMIDSYTLGKIERKSPEAPVPIINVKKEKIKLGGAANVALNIKNKISKNITLITKDINLRVKSDSLNIRAEDYYKDRIIIILSFYL